MQDPGLLLLRLGEQLRQLRLSRGLSQADLARQTGLPRLKVIQVEQGRAEVGAAAYAKVALGLGAEFTAVPARRPTQDEIAALFPLEEPTPPAHRREPR